MSFVSIDFLFFLPLFFAVYWLLRKELRLQNLFVIVGSYFFYGWADWRYMFLLGGYTAVSYFSGILLGKTERRNYRKLILWSVVAVNVGVLLTYKYFDFFVVNFNRVFLRLGMEMDWATLNLVLPIGISFFTFQALSYTIDVYRRKIAPTRDAITFFAFLSFFPQMVAGPIERADQLLPQFEEKRIFNYDSAVYGMKRILWGLVKKMVIADNCGFVVNRIFAFPQEMSSMNLWIGAFFFSMQIYGDFSGYSDIAVGCGRLLGIKLTENFRTPFFSRNLKELWNRWHVSLNRWLIDYVYIPLGGSRKGLFIMLVNIMIVFGISGMWHGAEFSYIAWGVFHGLMVCLTVAMALLFAKAPRLVSMIKHLRENRIMDGVVKGCGLVLTFLVFMIGFVFFRAHSVLVGGNYIRRMFMFTGDTEFVNTMVEPLLWYVGIFLVIEWVGRNKPCPICLKNNGLFSWRPTRWGFYLVLALTAFLFAGNSSDFIYFKF